MPLQESLDLGASYDAWPFYVVCDVSQSMWHKNWHPNESLSPHYIMNSSFAGMMEAIDRDISARHIAHLSVIAFHNMATVVTPLCEIADGAPTAPIYTLPKGWQTDYADVFRKLGTVIRQDTARLTEQGRHVKGPAVFFITDGQPEVGGKRQADEVWLRERDKLMDPQFPYRPRIIALGLGAVDERTLSRIATDDPAGAACIADTGATPADLLRSIIEIIIFSVTHSSASGSFVFETPQGMRRVV
ncbi:hypothetical protein ACIO53_31475 [Streptomyces sp. NPDC087305]|uniref:vWA domain-containing protein n=1 Tax=Streptomyces sp. NPDC087305 TaxID=3365781 RepID=UPI003801A40F